jgi:hypothetical protein
VAVAPGAARTSTRPPPAPARHQGAGAAYRARAPPGHGPSPSSPRFARPGPAAQRPGRGRSCSGRTACIPNGRRSRRRAGGPLPGPWSRPARGGSPGRPGRGPLRAAPPAAALPASRRSAPAAGSAATACCGPVIPFAAPAGGGAGPGRRAAARPPGRSRGPSCPSAPRRHTGPSAVAPRVSFARRLVSLCAVRPSRRPGLNRAAGSRLRCGYRVDVRSRLEVHGPRNERCQGFTPARAHPETL